MEVLTETFTDAYGFTDVVLKEPMKNSACAECKEGCVNGCTECSLYKAVKKLNELERILTGYTMEQLEQLVAADKERKETV